ncbi:MAG: hypothetical protein QHH07_04450 [Sedimentisphaerales bacterium]|jgi:hypothetical protein|nr:hypothetical protein [Sedimentisphaerales bacterium]
MKAASTRSAVYHLFSLMLLGGCAGPGTQPEPVVVSSVTPAQAFKTSLAVLAGMHFAIDKIDTDTGAIRTKPLAGGQFFEFWREDNCALIDHLRANLQTVSRTVWVTITPWSDGVKIDCLVRLQVLSIAREPVQTYSQAYATAVEPISALPQPNTEWVELGEDPYLARRILERIGRRLAKISGGNG